MTTADNPHYPERNWGNVLGNALGIDRGFIDDFVARHGHPPWVVCGDPDYGCLLENVDDSV